MRSINVLNWGIVVQAAVIGPGRRTVAVALRA
jgi:hypothetical protein